MYGRYAVSIERVKSQILRQPTHSRTCNFVGATGYQ